MAGLTMIQNVYVSCQERKITVASQPPKVYLSDFFEASIDDEYYSPMGLSDIHSFSIKGDWNVFEYNTVTQMISESKIAVNSQRINAHNRLGSDPKQPSRSKTSTITDHRKSWQP